ncbi:hypothetical protein, partial [Devosia ureilytica]
MNLVASIEAYGVGFRLAKQFQLHLGSAHNSVGSSLRKKDAFYSASRHRGIAASRHRGIAASRHRGIAASRHRGIAA